MGFYRDNIGQGLCVQRDLGLTPDTVNSDNSLHFFSLKVHLQEMEENSFPPFFDRAIVYKNKKKVSM